MSDELIKLRRNMHAAVWAVDITRLSTIKATWVRLARVVYTVVHEIADGQLNLRAMSLVYATLLALVPLLAVASRCSRPSKFTISWTEFYLAFLRHAGTVAPSSPSRF